MQITQLKWKGEIWSHEEKDNISAGGVDESSNLSLRLSESFSASSMAFLKLFGPNKVK